MAFASLQRAAPQLDMLPGLARRVPRSPRAGRRSGRAGQSGTEPGRVRGAPRPPATTAAQGRGPQRGRKVRIRARVPPQRPARWGPRGPWRASGRLTGAGGDGRESLRRRALLSGRRAANSGGEGRGPGRSLPAPPRPGGRASPPTTRRAPRAATRSAAPRPLHYLEVPATRR